MRARPAALVPVLTCLALFGAGCGGSSDDTASTPTPTPNTGGAVTGTSGTSATPPPDAQANTGLSTKDTLSEQIAKNSDLRTFSTALSAAGLTSLLDSGRYTVFAPNNDAFTKLGSQLDTLLQPGAKAQLVNILKFHIVKGKVKTKKLKDGELLTTLQGDRLRVTEKDGQLLIGNSVGKATILVPNAKAQNGIIHTVDTVLKPKTGASSTGATANGA